MSEELNTGLSCSCGSSDCSICSKVIIENLRASNGIWCANCQMECGTVKDLSEQIKQLQAEIKEAKEKVKSDYTNNSNSKTSHAHIRVSMIKKGGANPKPSTPKPENVAPPSQKPKEIETLLTKKVSERENKMSPFDEDPSENRSELDLYIDKIERIHAELNNITAVNDKLILELASKEEQGECGGQLSAWEFTKGLIEAKKELREKVIEYKNDIKQLQADNERLKKENAYWVVDRKRQKEYYKDLEQHRRDLQAEIESLNKRRPMTIEEARERALWSIEKRKVLTKMKHMEEEIERLTGRIIYCDGNPCKHTGCLSHRTHECEHCNRIGGHGEVVVRGEED